MSKVRPKAGRDAPAGAAARSVSVTMAPGPGPGSVETAGTGALFRRVDWIAFGATTFITLVVYLFTLAPDLTLEDCGELAVASYYLGVPHAPGYPIWTVYSWLFTVLLPFSNVAWRVAVSSAVAAALASGMLALITSRFGSMLLEGVGLFKGLEKKWEEALCLVSGFVAALLIGFNGFMWSQAVIVEVYTLSVLSLMGVLVCLLHWIYRPKQYRYLYLASFLFGICFNNHQTLIVAAMGLQVAIAMADEKLGRDALLVNVLFYVAGMFLARSTLGQNLPLAVIYHAVGLASVGGLVWLTARTRGLGSEWKIVLITLLAWVLGASFYFLLPLFSMTNPPMNWAYPRTFDGFIHAFTRGQYEKTNPTDFLHDPVRFIRQLLMYLYGAADEFNLAFLAFALVPFFFLPLMKRRERAWIVGNTAIGLCLSVLLLMLLNPQIDRQSRDLTRVFFTASHVIIAMFVGLAVTLTGASLLTRYAQVRPYALNGGAVLAALALYSLARRLQDVYSDPQTGAVGPGTLVAGLFQALAHPSATAPVWAVYGRLFVLLLVLGFVVWVLLNRERLKPATLVGLFALMPVFSLSAHWAENEQRGHLFGFWFGHDMFEPPFEEYPSMTRNAILFGGTDPGRFNPTYMIFAESFIKPHHRRNPAFDRRDVYIITQNALADGTYLNYIRAHYNRSAQVDPPFLRDMVVTIENFLLGKEQAERRTRGEPYKSTSLSRFVGSFTNLVRPIDDALLRWGARVEARRRAQGVYPPREIRTPSPEDLNWAFTNYIADVQMRYLHDQQNPHGPKLVRPGEVLNISPDGKVQVAGQTAVMAINGLLTKVIFDKNPDHEFFVEESFPLDWMYPYLTPFGIIMKINRQPVAEITQEMVERDHRFWRRYAARLCGDWIDYDTPVGAICEFVERAYLRGDLRGYRGDVKFVRDNDGQKAFSKLRNSIAGLYYWRFTTTTNPAERERMARESDFAFKQAFAFCPYSPETVTRYIQLLALLNRMDDALRVAQTLQKFDPDSDFARSIVDQVRGWQAAQSAQVRAESQLGDLEKRYATNREDLKTAFDLVAAYVQTGRTNEAYAILDDWVARTNTDVGPLLSIANAYVQIGLYARAEPALQRLLKLLPDSPEIWYDLAGAQAALGKSAEALQTLGVALQLDQRRRVANPAASNLTALAATDPRFLTLRELPEFKRLVGR